MRILHVNHLYHPSFGGNQVQSQGIAEKLVEFGEQVSVFTANAVSGKQLIYEDPTFEKLPEEEMVNGVGVRRFAHNHRLYFFLFNSMRQVKAGCWLQRQLMRETLDVWEHGPLLPGLLREIRRFRPDVLTAFNIYPTSTYICYLAKKFFGFSLVIRPSTHVIDQWFTHPVADRVLRAADRIICNTPFEKAVLLKQGIEEGKIAVIGNGINPGFNAGADPKRFREQHGIEQVPLVCFIGRKCLQKGVGTLIEAMKIVWQQNKEARLVLAGSKISDGETELKEKMTALSPQQKGRVIDLNNISHAEKNDLLAACDVFAMPSVIDSFGVTFLEAWCNAKPVIACRQTAQETIIDEGQNGFLIDFNDERQLAERILDVLNDAGRGRAMGENGRKKVLENFTWDIVGKKVFQLYEELFGTTRMKTAGR